MTEGVGEDHPRVGGQCRVDLELADATIIKWLEGKAPKKIIFVKGKMVNVVV